MLTLLGIFSHFEILLTTSFELASPLASACLQVSWKRHLSQSLDKHFPLVNFIYAVSYIVVQRFTIKSLSMFQDGWCMYLKL